jgi:hypothetical protein
MTISIGFGFARHFRGLLADVRRRRFQRFYITVAFRQGLFRAKNETRGSGR